MSDDFDSLLAEHRAPPEALPESSFDSLLAEHRGSAPRPPEPPKSFGRKVEEFAAGALGLMPRPDGAGGFRSVTPEEMGGQARSWLHGITAGRAQQLLGKVDPKNADFYNAEYPKAVEEYPGPNAVGAYQMPIPGTGKLKAIKGAKGVAARLLVNGGIGTGLGLATGDTDIAPEKRALIGLGLGLGGGAIGEVGAKVGQRAEAGIRQATADQGLLTTAARAKVMRSARSSLGGESSAVFSQIDRARDILSNPEKYGEELVSGAKSYLESPETVALMRNAASNMLEAGNERLQGSLQTARNVYDSAKAAMAPDEILKEVEAKMANPVREVVLPRLKHIANRVIPHFLGGAVGGPAGAVAGATASAAMGHPGTTISNMLKSPAFRAMAWKPLAALAPAAEATAPALLRAEAPAMEFASPAMDMRTRMLIEALRNKSDAPPQAVASGDMEL